MHSGKRSVILSAGSYLSILTSSFVVAVQFFAVGGAQQLNDKNGKKLALKFPSASKFAVVIAKLRAHLPGDDNLVSRVGMRVFNLLA
jgi:hypothetical protein